MRRYPLLRIVSQIITFTCAVTTAVFTGRTLGQVRGAGDGFGMGPKVTPEIVSAAAAASTPTADGPFQPTWESIQQNYAFPQWYVDGKFGITMHWGLFSVPAFHNEWYEQHMYDNNAIAKWHVATFGPEDKFGYKDFIPLFKAEKFDPDALTSLIKESGAKYFMPTCEHHDGFSLWDSAFNPYNAAQMGPKRDLIGELAVAARRQGLKFGVCNHSIEHYDFITDHPRAAAATPNDLDDPQFANFYWTHHTDENLEKFLEMWVNKNIELIDKYQLDILWFDNGANSRAYDPLKLKVAAYFYNRAKQWGKQVTMDTKGAAYLQGSVEDFEKDVRGPAGLFPGVWETENTLGSTWGYTEMDIVAGQPAPKPETFESPQALVSNLCAIVAKGGNLLLNLSPKADGSLTPQTVTDLQEIGKWLGVNGDAIYGTHSWTTFAEGGGRATTYFTVKGDNLYAIAQSWPGNQAVIASLANGKVDGTVTSVALLGHEGALTFTQDTEGLKITLPPDQPCKYAFSFKITGIKVNPPPALIHAGEPLTGNRNGSGRGTRGAATRPGGA
jgi:alpha-L-fucosidase